MKGKKQHTGGKINISFMGLNITNCIDHYIFINDLGRIKMSEPQKMNIFAKKTIKCT